MAGEVLEIDEEHRAAVLRGDLLRGRDDAAETDLRFVGLIRDLVDRERGLGEVGGVPGERVVGDVEAEELLLPSEPFLLGRGGCRFHPDLRLLERELTEEADGMRLLHLFHVLREGEDVVEIREEGAAFAELVQCADLREGFEGLFVEVFRSDTFEEILEVGIVPAAFPFGDDLLGGGTADVLDRVQSEADPLLAGIVRDDGEILEALVDGWGKCLDADLARLGHLDRDAVGIVLVARQECGHELGRIVRLEVGGLVADERVAGGVRPVEAVAGERFDVGEDLFGDLAADAFLLGAVDELDPLLGDELLDLLAHGLAEDVRFAEREAGEVAGDLHDLFLIDGDAVGVAEDGFELRMEVLHDLAAVLAVDEVGDPVHRTRPVERDHRDDVLEDGRKELLQVPFHAVRFELEDTGRACFLEEAVGRLVLERDPIEDVGRGGVLGETELPREVLRFAERADDPDRVLHDGEVLETEEVHLEKADLLDDAHLRRRGVLRHHTVAMSRDVLQGRVGDDRILGHDDAARVDGGVPRVAFEFLRGVDDLLRVRVLVVEFLQLGDLIDRFREGREHRDHLRDLVAERVGEAERAAGVADGRLGRHGPERDDLRDVVRAVPAPYVVEDVVPAVVGEVHVDVRHRDTLRIEEPLEEEIVLDRVEVRDAGEVGDERSRGRSAAGTDDDAVLLGPVHEVLHDEEVRRETGRVDDAELVVEARALFLADDGVAEPPLETFLAEDPEVGVRGEAVRDVVVRELGLAEVDLDVASFGDLFRVEDRVRVIREKPFHLLRGPEGEVEVREARASFLRDRPVVLDTHEDVVRVPVLRVEVEDVSRGDERDAGLAVDVEESFVDVRLVLVGDVRTDFEVEMILAEDVPILECGRLGPGRVVIDEVRGNLAGHVAGERDEPFVVQTEEVLVDAGLVIEAVELRLGDELEEVFVADLVLREEDDGVPRAVIDGGCLAEVVLHDVELDADDRFDAGILGLDVELDRAVHVGRVGEGERCHPEFLRLRDEVVDLRQGAEEGIVGVDVQMSEHGIAD